MDKFKNDIQKGTRQMSRGRYGKMWKDFDKLC